MLLTEQIREGPSGLFVPELHELERLAQLWKIREHPDDLGGVRAEPPRTAVSESRAIDEECVLHKRTLPSPPDVNGPAGAHVAQYHVDVI